jgi:hypothetical protein
MRSGDKWGNEGSIFLLMGHRACLYLPRDYAKCHGRCII